MPFQLLAKTLTLLILLPILLMKTHSAPILPEFEEMVDADAFFSFNPIDLKQSLASPRSLDYSIHKDFEAGLEKEFESGMDSAQKRRFSEVFLHSRIPLKIWSYVVSQGFDVELHYGRLEESLNFFKRQGYDFLYQVSPENPLGFEILVLPGGQGDIPGPGLFVITQVEDLALFKRFQYALKVALESLGGEAPAVRRIDFHVVGREAYQSARFKEVFHSLPVGTERVIGGEGQLVYEGLLARKFASMSINLLQGLYGPEFLNPLKRSLIEEGFLGIQDWNVNIYKALESNSNALLDASTYNIFLEFQKALVLALSQSPLKPISKILLAGNGLAIDKEGSRRKDIVKKFLLKSSLGTEHPIFAGILPIKSDKATAPLLLTGEVFGDSLAHLYEVLGLVGIREILHLGRVYSAGKELRAGELVVPGSLQGTESIVVSMKNFSMEKLKGLPVKSGLRGLYTLAPSNSTMSPDGIDFLDDHFYPAVRHFMDWKGDWKILGVCQEDMSETPISQWQGNLNMHQNLIEAVRVLYSIEDIDLGFSQYTKEFTSLEEKINHYDHHFNLKAEDTVLFHFALEDYFSRWLDDAQATRDYLKSASFQVAAARKDDPFTYFLQSPFKDQDVFAHILQVEKALMELRTYLRLMGENSFQVRIHGEFLTGNFTPLTPLVFSLDDISQKAFGELLMTPFSGRNSARRFLLRLVGSGERPFSSEGFDLSDLKEGDFAEIYLNILSGLGIHTVMEEGQRRLVRDRNEHHESIYEPVRRWYIGCETYLQLARQDFLREKSQVFAVAPWSEQRITQLVNTLKEGIVRLASEGLQMKEMIQESPLSEENKDEIYDFINKTISNLENFVWVFENQ